MIFPWPGDHQQGTSLTIKAHATAVCFMPGSRPPRVRCFMYLRGEWSNQLVCRVVDHTTNGTLCFIWKPFSRFYRQLERPLFCATAIRVSDNNFALNTPEWTTSNMELTWSGCVQRLSQTRVKRSKRVICTRWLKIGFCACRTSIYLRLLHCRSPSYILQPRCP